MRIYIVTDLEGVGGVVLPQQTTPDGGAMYEQARRWLTQEVNAALEGALEAGATYILVLDGHGANNACNFVLDELRPEAEYIMGSPWDKYLPGLDESFDCAFFIGFHSKAGTSRGVLEHTMSSRSWLRMRVNGMEMGELGLCAAFCGHFGVPVALVTGDKAVCDEARELLGDVETVAVKEGISRHSAKLLHPRKCQELIREAASRAVERARRGEFKPFLVEGPVTIEIEFQRTDYADGIKPPTKERIGPRTVVYKGRDIVEAFSMLF